LCKVRLKPDTTTAELDNDQRGTKRTRRKRRSEKQDLCVLSVFCV
jgi:hypothetical protein